MTGVVIAGGGLAGQRCADTLRRCGYEGTVMLVCGEDRPPYDRPPLSKAYLAGDASDEDLRLRPGGWHAAHDVDLVLGRAATGLDAAARRLRLDGGEELSYEHLVVATGSVPRTLPGTDGLENVLSLRTLTDARELRARLAPGARLVVLGAGLIGQEVAATARGLGADVTLVEAAALPLGRALHPALARWLVGVQREEGVDVRLGARVTALDADARRLNALRLADGSRLELDVLLVAIGVEPSIGWLGAGVADLSSREDVTLAGDVAGGDHWELAAHQGRVAAGRILGGEPDARPLTGWWSDVHGVRIQGLGDPGGADALIVDGDPRSRSFTAVATRAGRPVAALAAGRPRELPRLRALLAEPRPIRSEEAA